MRPSLLITFSAMILLLSHPTDMTGGEDNHSLIDIENRLDTINQELHRLNAVLTLIGERLPPGVNADLDQARTEATEARQDLEAQYAAVDLPAIEQRLQQALDARNAVIIDMLAEDPIWHHLRDRPAEVAEQIAALEGQSDLQADQLLALNAARAKQHRLEQARSRVLGTHSLWRHAPGVGDLNQAAWAIILQEQRPARGRITDLRDRERRLRDAEQALRQQQTAAARNHDSATWAMTRIQALEAERDQLHSARDGLYQQVLGQGPQWHHEIEVPRGPDRRGRERRPGSVSLWLPPDTPVVRGIILCDHIVIGTRLARDRRIRYTAAKHGLAIIRQFDSTFTEADAPEVLQGYLGTLAKLAQRPELDRIPLLTIGHSTGGIFARNVAYWQADRVMGIIHIKSGNMHHGLRPESRSLAGVPFLAINGELEDCGPEGGGERGIRSEYNHQTQWVMIREQMLRRRRDDADNLMSLVFHPGGGHTNWNHNLTHYCARFIHHAAQRRLPPAPADATTEVRCQALTAADGWLSDADLKGPRHPPAAYAQYAGDRLAAFWHLSEELAIRAAAIHAQSLLPDPSRHFPVDPNWP